MRTSSTGAHRPTPTITARLNFQLAFGARVGQRLAEAREEAQHEATRDKARVPGYRDRAAEQGDRAARPLPQASRARGTWRATRAIGGVLVGGAARRRPRRASGPGSAALRSCPARARRCSGDRAGRAARRGLRRRGVRAHAVRPGGRAQFPRHRLLRCPAHPAAGGRFGSVQAVGDYVDRVLSLPAVRDRWPVPAVTVRARRGATAAHYENRDGTAVIAVPERASRLGAAGTGGAPRDRPPSVSGRTAHTDGEFVSAFCELAETGDGPRGRARAAGRVRQGGRAATVGR